MRIGILGASEIAFRRFLPALEKFGNIQFAGVASRSPEKAQRFIETYSGKIYPTYDSLIDDPEINAVYLPLPPALHATWGERVIRSGKHLFMEKPFTTKLEDTERLVALAQAKDVALHENYMFLYHNQLTEIKRVIDSGVLGSIRLLRMDFGFPHRAETDFRYDKALGGGALLDCGGYPTRLAGELLGESAKVISASLIAPEGYEVDLFGNATVQNDAGLVAQISFGMDQTYRCSLDIWGSKSSLVATRIFTCPPDMQPPVTLDGEGMVLSADDAFYNSIAHFMNCIETREIRTAQYEAILRQSRMVNDIFKLGNRI